MRIIRVLRFPILKGEKGMEKGLSDSAVAFIRKTSIILGTVLILVSFIANTAGLSVSSGLSTNQVAFIIWGCLLIVAGIIGKGFIRFYRGTAFILLNTLIAIAFLETFSIVAVKIIDNERFATRQMKIENGNIEEAERMALRSLYVPYVIWKHDPSRSSEGITIDENGWRITPGNPEDHEASVFLFGGSAMWGETAVDSETIPSHLQSIFNDSLPGSIRVLNRGQGAWQSTQEVIQLMLLLRDGEIPDLVIFYDGFNDICPVYLSAEAGSHYEQDVVTARLNGVPPPPMMREAGNLILRASNTWLLVTSLRDRFMHGTAGEIHYDTYVDKGRDAGSLAMEIAAVYFGNADVARALGESYGFKCIFIIQPTTWYGEKRLTEPEREVLTAPYVSGDPAYGELMRATYALLVSEASSRDDMFSYANIFDDIDSTVYSDNTGSHIYGWANRIVAESLYRHIGMISPELLTEEGN